MRHTTLLAIGLGAMALLACNGGAIAADRQGTAAYVPTSEPAKVRYQRRRPVEVTIYRRRHIGGYSYRAPDVTSTYGAAPPPWMSVKQSPGGPFDSGFFFDSAIDPRGGNSPYMH